MKQLRKNSFFNIQYFSFILILLFFGGCRKDVLTISYDDISISKQIDLHFITSDHPGHFISIGGETWELGTVAESFDFGNSWNIDSVDTKIILDGCFDSRGDFLCIGFSGYIDRKHDDLWNRFKVNPWRQLLGVDSRNGNSIVVAGEGYKSGSIYTLDSMFSVICISDFNYELSTVSYFSDSTVLVGGYGIILKSLDGGISWDSLNIDGDNFIDFAFTESDSWYCIGARGSIYKTIDLGSHWEVLRNANKLNVSHKAFNAIDLLSDDEIIIVGDEGLCWFSNNRGINWKEIKGLPELDFYDVYIEERKVYISGEDGMIINFDL